MSDLEQYIAQVQRDLELTQAAIEAIKENKLLKKQIKELKERLSKYEDPENPA